MVHKHFLCRRTKSNKSLTVCLLAAVTLLSWTRAARAQSAAATVPIYCTIDNWCSKDRDAALEHLYQIDPMSRPAFAPPELDQGIHFRINQGDFSDREFQPLYLNGSLDRYFGTASSTHTCGNLHGANVTVPYGSYHGENLMGLSAILNRNGSSLQEFWTNFTQNTSGWNFEPGAVLVRTATTFNPTVVQSGITSAPFNVQCHAVTRYAYMGNDGSVVFFQNRGLEQSCDFTVHNTSDQTSCLPEVRATGEGAACLVGPTELWSTDGQISLSFPNNDDTAVLHFPNGNVEVMSSSVGNPYRYPQSASVLSFNEPRSTDPKKNWGTITRIDRNGRNTQFAYNASKELVSVTDPEGRVTKYERDPADGTIKSITAPGPGSTSLKWTVTWSSLTWNPQALFPDVDCVASPGGSTVHGNQICTNSLSYKTVTAITIPDGRTQSFSYTFPISYKFGAQTGWGNLTQMTMPDGAVFTYDYGDDTSIGYRPPGQDIAQCPVGGGGFFDMDAVYRRRITGTSNYPQGPAGPVLSTKVKNNNIQNLLSGPTPGKCHQLQWVKTVLADGHIRKEANCDEGGSGIDYGSVNGRKFAQEDWDSTNTVLLEASYFGNTGTIGDTETSVGTMYVDYENSSTNLQQTRGQFLDVRPYKVIHFKDGIQWTEKLFYEASTIPAGTTTTCTSCTAFRTTGNTVRHEIIDATGASLRVEATTYFHGQAYDALDLLRLPQTVKVTDPSRGLLSRTDNTYDEYLLARSLAANLTDPGPARGNLTTQTSYTDPRDLTTSVASHTHYYDTGDVQQKIDPNGNATTMVPDFSLCSASQALTSSVTLPVVNGVTNKTTTVRDCNLGVVLSVTDPNGQSTYTQYDRLGRAVETAVPGDTLSAIDGFIRDPNIPTSRLAGTTLGNNGNGATTWTEYFRFGIEVTDLKGQRTVAHTKDGTTDGRYLKTFTDGLGRTTQTRSKVDPAVSGNNAEVVATIVYDGMGRVSASYVPVFAVASDSYVTPADAALATFTSYDALGRTISVQPPGLPATTTSYGGSGTKFSTTLTDANGNVTKTFTDLLGHVVQVSRQAGKTGDPACAADNILGGSWCTKTMDYDALGRLLRVTDEAFNQTTFVYDGLGRKTQMTDMDMGTWNYGYDANGNLVSQTDNKSQVIKMHYDALNRITWKDLPPNDPTPGIEDMTFCYDGKAPPCYP